MTATTVRVGDARYSTTAPTRRRTARRAPVETITVSPTLWRAALDVADGDPARLVILDRATVLVLNRPRTAATVRKYLGTTKHHTRKAETEND